MQSPIVDSYKREATIAVLSRLGKESLELVKQSLISQYDINIDKPETYTLSKLHAALTVLLGDYGAALVAREISDEIKFLTSVQYH